MDVGGDHDVFCAGRREVGETYAPSAVNLGRRNESECSFAPNGRVEDGAIDEVNDEDPTDSCFSR